MHQDDGVSGKLEDTARELGVSWGTRLRAQYLKSARTLGSWPGSLDEARRLIDTTIGEPLAEDERELLALLAERGARRAWQETIAPPVDRTGT